MIDVDATFVVDNASAGVIGIFDEPDTVDVVAVDDGIVDETTDSVVGDDTPDTDCVCIEDSTDDLVVVSGTTVVVPEAVVDDDNMFFVD